MSLSNNFPTIAPSLNLSFALTKALDPRITFTRTTTATYYDGKTTAKAEENLLLQSQDFSTTWVGFDEVLTGSQTAPDGTSTAWELNQEAGTTPSARISQNGTVVASQDYVISIFAKANTRDFLAIQEQIADNSVNISYFDLSTGTLGTINADHTAAITNAGGGWYRCSIKLTANAARTASILFRAAEADNTTAATDDGKGILIWGAQLEQRSAVSAYTPTTTQPITNYIPVLLTAASGVARFDHNPTTGESLGLLVEEQRTNLVTYSEQFDNAAWTKAQSSITANTIVAPDGTLTGDRIVENTAASQARSASRTTTTTASTTYTLSVFAKEDPTSAKRYLRLALNNVASTANWAAATFNLATGVVEGTNAVGTGFVVSATSITPVGNGWYRCSISGQIGTNTDMNLVISWNPTAGTYTNRGREVYTGDGYSGIFIWGAQLEAGAFPTSYIPTVAATVTRNADVATMTGTNFSSWFNNAEGTLLAQYSPIAVAGTQYIVAMDNGAGFADSCILYMVSSGFPRWDVFASSSTQAALTPAPSTAISANTSLKLIGAYLVNDFAASRNGGAVSTDTFGTVPTLSRLSLGNSNLTTSFLNGTIRKISYYPARLSDAQLQALTTV